MPLSPRKPTVNGRCAQYLKPVITGWQRFPLKRACIFNSIKLNVYLKMKNSPFFRNYKMNLLYLWRCDANMHKVMHIQQEKTHSLQRRLHVDSTNFALALKRHILVTFSHYTIICFGQFAPYAVIWPYTIIKFD